MLEIRLQIQSKLTLFTGAPPLSPAEMGISQPVALVVELLILFSKESSSFSLTSSGLEVSLASWAKVLASGQPRCLKLGGFWVLEGGEQGSLEALVSSLSDIPLAQSFCSCSDLDQAASSPEHQVNMALNKFLPDLTSPCSP